MVITIDGPAGAGKSTVARKLAGKLNYKYLDTGAMYRAVTLLALEKGMDLADDSGLSSLAENIEIDFSAGGSRIKINDRDITEKIRTQKIDKNVSRVAEVKEVRQAMVNEQRRIGNRGNIVVEGRDTGTRVFPEAEVKIYLTASLEERARRRIHDLNHGDMPGNIEAVKEQLRRRDKRDKTRKYSPLKRADDALKIDTTNLTTGEVVNKIAGLVRRKDTDG